MHAKRFNIFFKYVKSRVGAIPRLPSIIDKGYNQLTTFVISTEQELSEDKMIIKYLTNLIYFLPALFYNKHTFPISYLQWGKLMIYKRRVTHISAANSE